MTQARPRWRWFVLAALVAGRLGLAAAPSAAASSLADYRVTFDATWSAATHPTGIPPGPHFSPLVGATHNDQLSLWQTGQLASDGIEDMAELGATAPLLAEIVDAIVAGDAESSILGSGTNSPGQVVVEFTASQAFSRLSLVAMLAPSPDWFVGVSGVELLTPGPGGDWVEELVVDLHAYDAGTDSGVSYLSADSDTVPPEDISLITSSPFDGGVPLGTFTITRIEEPPQESHLVPVMSPWGAAILVTSLACGALAFGQIRRRQHS